MIQQHRTITVVPYNGLVNSYKNNFINALAELHTQILQNIKSTYSKNPHIRPQHINDSLR